VLCTKSSTNRVGDEQVNEVLPRTVLAVHPSTKAKLLRPAAWGVTSSMTSATNDSVRTPELTAIDSVRTPEPTTNDSVRTPESTMVAASTPGHQEPNPLLAASTTGLRGPGPLVAASTPGCQGPKRLPSSPKALGSAVNGGREHTWLPRAQTSALFHQGSGLWCTRRRRWMLCVRMSGRLSDCYPPTHSSDSVVQSVMVVVMCRRERGSSASST
jgi:hypothetical protein